MYSMAEKQGPTLSCCTPRTVMSPIRWDEFSSENLGVGGNALNDMGEILQN